MTKATGFKLADFVKADANNAMDWKTAYEHAHAQLVLQQNEVRSLRSTVQRHRSGYVAKERMDGKRLAWAKDILCALVAAGRWPEDNPDPWMELAEEALEGADTLLVAADAEGDPQGEDPE